MYAKRLIVSLLALNLLFFAGGLLAAKFLSKDNFFNSKVQAQVDDESPTPTPADSGSSNGQSGGFSSGDSAPTPTPTVSSVNAFEYTPLPSDHGPEQDIAQVGPISASRNTVQVDDSVAFSVTIKNEASYNKDIQSLCFESTDGNFGCIFGINLAPGATYTANNVGTWTSGGAKKVWIDWTQDGRNFYSPVSGSSALINVLG
ncbi:MAG TPA: hypothetical protein VG965_01580 [Patescibacteria group bacterium]|nr:hypothetical protein [Patescibacteria group bacterium]